MQILEEEDEFKFPFDILDATKLWPEELVPVRRIGKMTLNRNPDNFFAETEQVAFHTGHLVPGIDVTNDPLLQGRLFSYLDTQLSRLGGPNFAEIPINKSHRAGAQQPARRHAPRPRSTTAARATFRIRSGSAVRCWRRSRRADTCTTPSRSRARRSASGARASRTTSVRPGCSSTACRRPRNST